MELDTYQELAQHTDKTPRDEQYPNVSLLGLIGEAGGLLTEYKKRLRDGDGHVHFSERVAEELGDILWYLANVACKEGLSLSHIAEQNLVKTRHRWTAPRVYRLFDEGNLPGEQLPRKFRIQMKSFGETVIMLDTSNGKNIGNSLTDNSYENDGYRYHDIFHLAYAAVLGWSPVLRSAKILNCKRRTDTKVDEVEDGGRAGVIEEGVAAAVFSYAQEHNFLEGVSHVDWTLLRSIKGMTRHLEVRERTEWDWEQAILAGFSAWRQIRATKEGIVVGDLYQRSFYVENGIST